MYEIDGIRYWTRALRLEYNETDRAATRVFSVHSTSPSLWLGSQIAANYLDYLEDRQITVRLSALGSWGTIRAEKLHDMKPFRVDDYCRWESLAYPKEFCGVVKDLDARLQKENVLVFCRQGARRSSVLAGAYILAKTGEPYDKVFDYLRSLRALLDPVVKKDLWYLSQCSVFMNCLRVRCTLPLVITPKQDEDVSLSSFFFS